MSPRRALSRQQKMEPEVIELSSDSESDLEEDEGSDSGTGQNAPAIKREVVEHSQDNLDSAPKASPRNHRLPMRGKDGDVKSHPSFSLELSVSSRSRDHDIRDSQEPDEDDYPSGDFQSRPRKKLITFDDDNDQEFVTPREYPLKNPLETTVVAREDEDDDSDDDSDDSDDDDDEDDDAPPEAISSHAAHVELTKTKEAALRAVRMQDVALKRKRQDHDVLLQQQAMGRQTAKDDSQPAKLADPDMTRPAGETSLKSDAKMPDLLPPELLASDDEDDAPTSRVGPELPSKKIRFEEAERKLARESRPARDERVGSTIYRVVASKSDQRMAPRTNANSRARKMQLLTRNRTPQRKKTGFLVKN